MKLIALFRGINVSGQKLIKMADLKKLLEDNGFKQVVTYIQSGNILFESKEKEPLKNAAKMKSVVKKKYGFDVEILVLDEKYLKTVVGKNPYMKRKDFDEKKLYVSFLNSKPEKSRFAELEKVKSGADEWHFHDQQIYFYCPDGYGKTKFSNNLVESKLKVTATTRNWNTVNVLYKLIAES